MIRSCQIMLQLQASIQGNRTNSQVLKSPTRPGQPATLPPGILLQNKPAMLVQQQPAAVTVSASNIQQVQVSTGSSGGGYLKEVLYQNCLSLLLNSETFLQPVLLAVGELWGEGVSPTSHESCHQLILL